MDSSLLYAMRHSLSHLMAQAVQELYPNSWIGFGPPTEHGFYHDFDLKGTLLHEKDLVIIQNLMKRMIEQDLVFLREEVDFETAKKRLEHNPYKQEQLVRLSQKGIKTFSFFRNGEKEDLCEGPHVERTGLLPKDGFQLDSIGGAYLFGDESRPMLTRIYGLAFPTKAELELFLKRRELAQSLDHKKLGKDLELFTFHDLVGKGMPLWLPNGTILREELEQYAKDKEFEYGYERVSTPVLGKKELFLTSQHLPAYEDSMFPAIENDHGESWYLRPMTCPHHHLVYASQPRSYKDLPLRLAEYANLHRYEQSGELTGLLRVRSMCLNDAHLYCREDQIFQEIRSLLSMYQEIYDTLKISKKSYSFRLSLGEAHSHKYKGDPELWKKAESILKEVLEEQKIPYYEAHGEAAFYGPKIDIQFRNLMGREETASTIQVDFLGSVNFDLFYTDSSGEKQRPVIIHRAPLSTHERFISFVTEYYGGAFPTWLAPIQVCILPVHDKYLDAALKFQHILKSKKIRSKVLNSQETLGKRIRQVAVQKIPHVLILGEKEVQNQTLTWKRYAETDQKSLPQEEFLEILSKEIEKREAVRPPLGGREDLFL